MSISATSNEIQEVAPGVWVGIPGFGEGAMGAVVQAGSGVVIDTTSYDTFASEFIERVDTLARGPVNWKALLITHRHYDHFAGAGAIPAPTICHRLTREALAGYTRDWLDRNVAQWLAGGLIDPARHRTPTIPTPAQTFDTRLTVHLGGGVDVVMTHTGGHTSDESMVYLPQQQVLFGGDNIFNQRTAFTGHGDVIAWISALEEARRLPISVVVPGHGPIGGPELIDAQIDVLKEHWHSFIRGEA